jgi:sulfate transport system ATP-binding protein
MSIEARGVSKSFGDFHALRDVTVTIKPGQLTAVLGPSGGGKSTLLRVIAGLETPDSGTVVINDVDVTNLPARKRGIGFVFQHYAAFTHMTVWQNVAFGLSIAHAPKEKIRKRVDELLELVHLDGLSARYPSELSGGQRQRSRSTPGCYCSTNRSAPSTSRSARSCGSGCGACTTRCTPRPSS